MPTIDIDYYEFEQMLDLQLDKDIEKINEILAFVKGEVKLFNEEEGILSVEIKDTNRPDTWSVEGLVRALRGFLGIATGLPSYVVGKQLGEVFVDQRLDGIRPFIGCALVEDVSLSDKIIRSLMHLQEKLDQTYGRNRQKTSIGLYNLDLIKLPLHYSVAKPEEVSFVPLGFTEKMTLKEILATHPKGLEYGHIISKHPVYPVLLDSEGKPLSFPPIINSNNLGRVTAETKNVLVEVTGTHHNTVCNTLNLVTLSLVDRGGKAFSMKVHYPHRKMSVSTPDFNVKEMRVNLKYANKILGLKLTTKQTAELLSKAGYDVAVHAEDEVCVRVPCYRIDVMHPIDIVEDIAIAYDYNKIKPQWRRLPTTGWQRPEEHWIRIARELMIGLGFQEVLTYTLTSPEKLFTKMNLKRKRVVELSNPKFVTMTCLRNQLLPSLLEFVSNNLHVECPQRVFELGKVTLLDAESETRTRDEERLAAVVYHANAGFSEGKSVLDAFLANLGLNYQLTETVHPSFIEGRVGIVNVENLAIGVLGELAPSVLECWKLENPVVAFELRIEEILRIKLSSGV
ncbi:MAG: phenylalanine--tRNA ligase subunit beta [Candidatus Bathyarchaeota archaeon]|nr:phenylalanine--tRNA ligase subunit beta [Candidatus Bathyarchaeota archaeon]